eukprot:scaffold21207_cov43-Phaeocystis_antarctica.AAC.3
MADGVGVRLRAEAWATIRTEAWRERCEGGGVGRGQRRGARRADLRHAGHEADAAAARAVLRLDLVRARGRARARRRPAARRAPPRARATAGPAAGCTCAVRTSRPRPCQALRAAAAARAVTWPGRPCARAPTSPGSG